MSGPGDPDTNQREWRDQQRREEQERREAEKQNEGK